MTREEKLQKAHQMFDNRNLLIELKWQREYFKRGYVSNQEELFNLWIFDECIKALEQEPRWIPVSERLPEIQNYSGNYLVTLKSGGVHIGMFIERNGKHWWTHYDDVVAWMPLPEPYKESE